MIVGAAEDVARQQDPAFAQLEMDKARLAGLDTIRITQSWVTGQTALGPQDEIELGNAVTAAQLTGLRVVLSIYPYGSSVTPLSDQDRADFAAFCVDLANRYPLVATSSSATSRTSTASGCRNSGRTARISRRPRTSNCSPPATTH